METIKNFFKFAFLCAIVTPLIPLYGISVVLGFGDDFFKSLMVAIISAIPLAIFIFLVLTNLMAAFLFYFIWCVGWGIIMALFEESKI